MHRRADVNIAAACKWFVTFVCCITTAAGSDREVCPRPAESTVASPPEIKASSGRLRVSFAFRSQVNESGLTRYCYISENGVQAPTLRVWPGDEMVLDLKNELTAAPSGKPEHRHAANSCSGGVAHNGAFHQPSFPRS
jgi:hypothetical protein